MRTRATRLGAGILTVWFGGQWLWASSDVWDSWNPKAAAVYLNRRENWWRNWPPAARDHGTFCVSCHTAVPYALARPALRAAVGEVQPTEEERKLLDDVVRRVRLGNEAGPFYTESAGAGKALQSRGTESVLNALILAAADAPSGRMSEPAQAAFAAMWALQDQTTAERGSWPWLDFGNEPFEAADSRFYGASLAALAVGMAPAAYRATPALQNQLQRLREYLGREYSRQPLIHQVVALWAAQMWPGLLSAAQRKAIVAAVISRQQSDGGWSLAALGWTWRGASLRLLVNLWIRSDDSPVAGKSDGYATGLIVYVLGQSGLARGDRHWRRGWQWLLHHQNPEDGTWPGYSLVNRRDPRSGTGRFMTDAATAYAVLALTARR